MEFNLRFIFLFTFLFLMGCSRQTPVLENTWTPFQDLDSTPEEETPQEQPIPERPDGAITLEEVCACENGEPISINKSLCSSTCSSKNSVGRQLFIEASASAAITLSDLQNIQGWCSIELIDPNTNEPVAVNPSCALEVKTSDNETLNPLEVTISGSTIIVDLTQLSITDKTLRLKLIELTSGASSFNYIQTKLDINSSQFPNTGILGIVPITQYTCMSLTTSSDQNTGQLFFDDASRQYFFYNPEIAPDPVPSGVVNFYCHDIFSEGVVDRGGDRLEQTPGAFSLWNRWDTRFFDSNADSVMDVHNIIQENVENQGATLSSTPNIFFEFQWSGLPQFVQADGEVTVNSTSPSNQSMGYYMTPWVNQNTFKAFCPKQADYYGDNLLFKAMREIVGVDTEALYIAKKEGLGCTYTLIRENLAKKIWFYKENNVPIEPNADTIVGKKVQFYWPADTSSPFIKKSHQSTFTIRSIEDLQNDPQCNGGSSLSSATNSGVNSTSNYPPHDKRIGCVPATSD